MIIQLPAILPGDLDLSLINQQLHQHEITLDWTSVISAPQSQLAILLGGLDLVEDADWLGTNGEITENIANDILNYFKSSQKQVHKSKKKQKSEPEIATPKEASLQTSDVNQSKASKNQDIQDMTDITGIPKHSNQSVTDINHQVINQPDGLEIPAQAVLTNSNTPPTRYEIRQELETAIIRDLVGPYDGEEEQIDEKTVTERYLVGLVAPRHRYVNPETTEKLGSQTAPQSNDGEIPDDNGLDDDVRELDNYTRENFDDLSIVGESSTEDGSTELNVPPAETMFPSSIGMSFCVSKKAQGLTIIAGWGQYHRTHTQSFTKSETKNQSLKNHPPTKVWQRQQIRASFDIPSLTDGKPINWKVAPEYPEVYVTGQIKRQNDSDFIVTLFLVNGQKETKNRKDQTWLFQPELKVKSIDSQYPDIFVKRNLSRPLEKSNTTIDAEERTMAMLYRKHREFAIGHGVSVHAKTAPETTERAVELSISVIPIYEVPKTTPPESTEIPQLAELVLDMQELSITQTADFLGKLNPLITAYSDWIDTQIQRVSEKTIANSTDEITSYTDVARANIKKCQEALNRIREGLILIKNDENAADAFRFMNQAMYLQRIHALYSEQIRQGNSTDFTKISSTRPCWFPFQLAFILLNLPSITDLHHPHRSHPENAVADLLWFPTGGGKTEAYLGLTAYTIALRRLQGDIAERSGEFGVAVLMRYTLRLLTLQQFQRGTTLICACESIRRKDETKWGKEPFRIGLWVGQRTTPNCTRQSEEFSRQERGQYKQVSTGSPHQLTNCPWCGSKIEPGKQIKVENLSNGRGRTLIYCGDNLGECLFSERQSPDEGLPVVVVDEEIYRRLPTLLIATVDKFAQMPWKGEIQMLFGQVDSYCPRHGFRSSDIKDKDKHRQTPTLPATHTIHHSKLRPPDLIIQDELHLISGPLGTLVGLYETAVDELASWKVKGKKVRPKVVASTATIRQAEAQIRNLFLRDVHIFPPQGLEVEDNFFSRQRTPSEDHPGRRYVGICATGRRLKAALIRVYVAILSASQDLYEKYGEEADPWMTLVGYFNSIRELGGMRRLVEDDVKTRLGNLNSPNRKRRQRLNLEELTSRKDSTDIPIILDRLEKSFNPQKEAQIKAKKKAKEKISELEPLDVLLATNMISVGVDVKRLGMMVVTGQPKNTAEYIQSTSRVGRTYPGLVVTVYNWARPRDLSHYERFAHYHATFYQHVEALSLTPFAPRAIDRGLAALFVSLVRLAGREFNGNDQAANMESTHDYVKTAIDTICDRAALVGDIETSKMVKQALEKKLEIWLKEAKNRDSGRILKYQVEKRDGVTVELLKSAGKENWQEFTCLNSLRNVEPAVGLIFQNQVPDDDIHRLPEPITKRKEDVGEK